MLILERNLGGMLGVKVKTWAQGARWGGEPHWSCEKREPVNDSGKIVRWPGGGSGEGRNGGLGMIIQKGVLEPYKKKYKKNNKS